jgi:hypothetical protein
MLSSGVTGCSSPVFKRFALSSSTATPVSIRFCPPDGDGASTFIPYKNGDEVLDF